MFYALLIAAMVVAAGLWTDLWTERRRHAATRSERDKLQWQLTSLVQMLEDDNCEVEIEDRRVTLARHTADDELLWTHTR